jgi:steroid 5-alpha reductase family enzyme
MTAILLINFVTLTVVILILWRVSIRLQDVSFIDAFWPFGMVIMAVMTYFQSPPEVPMRKLALSGLTALWGMRLAVHLYTRWRAHGVDPRYAKMIGRLTGKKGWSFGKAALIQVFGMQGPLLFVVCLPAQLGQFGPQAAQIGMMGWAGIVAALTGIAFETTGDSQLTRFREDPANQGKVLDSGVWRYTRHPNYFGDALTWWGIWLVASESVPGRWAIAGPILITWLLTRVSGVPMLEYSLKKNRPGYEDYIERTSSFFPWPPKR